MKKYVKLGNRTIEEAKEDLRHLNDPTCLSYSDNYYAKSLRDKYGMNTIKLYKVIKELEDNEMADITKLKNVVKEFVDLVELKEEADLNNELYRRGELR